MKKETLDFAEWYLENENSYYGSIISIYNAWVELGKPLACSENKLVNGFTLVLNERKRQINEEGYSKEHDKKHTDGSIAAAAACYALPYRKPATETIGVYKERILDYPEMWPWDVKYWKPTPSDRIKELVKAGALIVAEIDRLLDLSNSN